LESLSLLQITFDMVYMGIDPGSTGAISVIHENKQEVYRHSKGTLYDMWDFISAVKKGGPCVAVLEKVHSMPGQGVASTFKFGQNYGMVKAFLVAARIPFTEVTPQSWMKFYGMKKTKTESKTDWKRRLKERAQQLYPDMKITNDMADAILISHYCMKIS